VTAQKTANMTESVRGPADQKRIAAGGQALVEGMEIWLTTARDCQRRMFDFMSNRLAKDGEAMREILACRNPIDAMAIHSRWVQETIQDYLSEMTEMIAISTKQGPDSGQRGR
jgi:Phasin protein